MKVTWNWLAEFVELEQTPEEVASRLAMAGLEVESIETRGRELMSVYVAEIGTVRPHPQADRLALCEIRTAGGESKTVVCGAPNAKAGLRVAFAAPGTVLPNGQTIVESEIRGVRSAGMLCSESELGIGPETDGILTLPDDAPLGESLATWLRLDDRVLDISITPNRGDCLSVVGLAREISALTGQRLKRTRIAVSETSEAAADGISIHVADPDLCRRYVCRVIEGIKIAPSPLWMQYRLRAVGMRPINNVVDVTNYVMLERGQPLHAFDYDRLEEKQITVRRAGSDVEFTTLDGQTRQLVADDLLITSGAHPVALAGIMGGENSEVTGETTRILLESAWFAPTTVRRTARRLGLRSEASFRFERSVDLEGVGPAADRAASLIARLSGGRVQRGRVDAYPGAAATAPISVRLKRVDDLLGMSIPRAELSSRLKALGMDVSPATRGTISVVPPTYRSDLTREIDIIEEIVRTIGYEHVPTTVPETALSGTGLAPEEQQYRALRRLLLAQGLTEAVVPTFTSPRLNSLLPVLNVGRGPVRLINPMSQDDSELRLSLASSLVRVTGHNLAQGNDSLALFILGKTFWHSESFAERMHLGGVICPGFPMRGIGSAPAASDFADLKGVVESVLEEIGLREVEWRSAADAVSFHPGKTAKLWLGEHCIGVAGALHPATTEELDLASPCWLFELDLLGSLQYGPPRVGFHELPRFPVVRRDIAIVVEDRFAADEVVRFVRRWVAGAALIEEVQVFDEYSGPPIPAGKKSLTYSIAYRAADRTLTDHEVNELHAKLTNALTGGLDIQLR